MLLRLQERHVLARPTGKCAGTTEHHDPLVGFLALLAVSFVLRIGVFHAFNLLSNEVDFDDSIDEFA